MAWHVFWAWVCCRPNLWRDVGVSVACVWGLVARAIQAWWACRLVTRRRRTGVVASHALCMKAGLGCLHGAGKGGV